MIYASAFAYGGGPKITIHFSKDVGASLVREDLSILNRTTSQTLDMAGVAFLYDPSTQTATWTLPADLADGNYRASIAPADVTDAQTRQLDGNGDGTAGDPFQYDFYHLGGDANGDRAVDFNDLVKLAQNYNTTSGDKTYADGDFTFDGNVDFNDLVVLAQRYNTSLPAAGEPIAAGAPLDPVTVAESLGFALPAPATPPQTKPAITPKPVQAPKPAIKPVPPPKPVIAAKSKPIAKNVPCPAVVTKSGMKVIGATLAPPPATSVAAAPFGKKKVFEGLY
jgi:hypothetical protein